MTEYRKHHLTDPEWNAISKLTRETKLDSSFDIYTKHNGDDCFEDLETGRLVSLSTGLKWLYSGMAYPLSHEGLDVIESALIVSLFKEFKTTNDDVMWLMEKEE